MKKMETMKTRLLMETMKTRSCPVLNCLYVKQEEGGGSVKDGVGPINTNLYITINFYTVSAYLL